MLPDGLAIIHQPARLQIMALLAKHRDVGFAAMRDALGLTDGNLQSHCRRLEDAGLVESRRALGATGVVVQYAITRLGDDRVAEYAAWLQAWLDGLAGASGVTKDA